MLAKSKPLPGEPTRGLHWAGPTRRWRRLKLRLCLGRGTVEHLHYIPSPSLTVAGGAGRPWLTRRCYVLWLSDVTVAAGPRSPGYELGRPRAGSGRPRTTMTATLRWCHCHIQVEWHSGCSGAARGRVTDGGRHHEVARLGHPQRLESA